MILTRYIFVNNKVATIKDTSQNAGFISRTLPPYGEVPPNEYLARLTLNLCIPTKSDYFDSDYITSSASATSYLRRFATNKAI